MEVAGNQTATWRLVKELLQLIDRPDTSKLCDGLSRFFC